MNEHNGGPFIYSALGGITCAICAPAFMAADLLSAARCYQRWQQVARVRQEQIGIFATDLSHAPPLRHDSGSFALVFDRCPNGDAVGDRRGATGVNGATSAFRTAARVILVRLSKHRLGGYSFGKGMF
jgi:hypothetical protein